MFETLTPIVSILNGLSPVGLAGMLAFIIYHLVAKKGRVRAISDNHLSGLPEMAATLIRIEESNKRQESVLSNISNDISFVKGRIK
jgi:hypothetical protein